MLLGQVVREGLEFVAERHGHGVLQLGAAHLEDILEFVALGVEGLLQSVDALDEVIQRGVDAEAEAGGVCIVRGLGHVDVIVGVDDVVAALLLAEVLEREVCHNLVRVHVERGARAALEDVERELVHAAALFKDLVAGPDDGLGLLLRQDVEAAVGHRGGLLHLHHAADEVRDGVDGDVGNLEVLHGAQRVDAVVRVSRNFHVAEQVGLGAGFLRGGLLRRLFFLGGLRSRGLRVGLLGRVGGRSFDVRGGHFGLVRRGLCGLLGGFSHFWSTTPSTRGWVSVLQPPPS